MDIIIFSLLAIYLIIKLRSVLGSEDEATKKMRKEMTEAKLNEMLGLKPEKEEEKKENNNVVQIIEGEVEDEIEEEVIGQKFENDYKKIREMDRSFSVKFFLEGAKTAYEMVLEDFVIGKKENLKALLSKDLYSEFAKLIDANIKSKKYESFDFIGIDSAKVTDIKLRKNIAQVTVEFVSEQIENMRNQLGEIIKDSQKKEIYDSEDEWVFERDLKSSNPNWQIIAT